LYVQAAADLNRRRPLPGLQSLARDFRRFDELTAFIQAASVVEFLAEKTVSMPCAKSGRALQVLSARAAIALK
jgi:hypothetical protein